MPGNKDCHMNDNKRAPAAVTSCGGRPAPEPFDAEYGPITDEMLAYIDRECPQDQFAEFVTVSRFE